MHLTADTRPGGVALESRLGQAYDEETFRYFLDAERKRATCVGRPLLLLLVDVRDQSHGSVHIDPAPAAKLFLGLWRCVRETDIVGWYREEHVAGVVLTQITGEPNAEPSLVIRERVREELAKDLPAAMSRGLRLRLRHLGPRLKD